VSPRYVVLVPDRVPAPAEIEQNVFGDSAEVIAPCAKDAAEIDDATWGRADAVLAWHDLQYPRAVIGKLVRCKVIVRVGVGTDNVDLAAAGERGIAVCNVPDYGTCDVADHALALTLALSRGLPAFSELVRQSAEHWHWNAAGRLRRLTSATMGIIGLGRIGSAVALRAKAFGMRVVFHDPYVPDGKDKSLAVERCDRLEDLLERADVVSLHTPLTDETRGMAGRGFFARLADGALLVNTARGPIVDLDALEAALRSGRLRGAGLDVLAEEPPPAGHPLIAAWRAREPWIAHRLIVTPHAAFYCDEAWQEMRHKAAVEALRVLRDEPPRNCVNRHWLAGR
jgi:phosphoglycerate dehydrogenase-like enzyme